MKKIFIRLMIMVMLCSAISNMTVWASDAEFVVTDEQLEAMNKPTGEDAEKLSYLTLSGDELIEQFKSAAQGVENTDTYKANKWKFSFSTNTDFFTMYFPNWTPEMYKELSEHDKFCVFYLFYIPYSNYVSDWEFFEEKDYILGYGDKVDAAYAKVIEWHKNNYELYNVFVNPYDDGVVKEEEKKSDEEELAELQEEIAEELGVETEEGKYEKAWKNLLISNIIAVVLLIIAVVVFFVTKRKVVDRKEL